MVAQPLLGLECFPARTDAVGSCGDVADMCSFEDQAMMGLAMLMDQHKRVLVLCRPQSRIMAHIPKASAVHFTSAINSASAELNVT